MTNPVITIRAKENPLIFKVVSSIMGILPNTLIKKAAKVLLKKNIEKTALIKDMVENIEASWKEFPKWDDNHQSCIGDLWLDEWVKKAKELL